jgi:hypothetical protein
MVKHHHEVVVLTRAHLAAIEFHANFSRIRIDRFKISQVIGESNNQNTGIETVEMKESDCQGNQAIQKEFVGDGWEDHQLLPMTTPEDETFRIIELVKSRSTIRFRERMKARSAPPQHMACCFLSGQIEIVWTPKSGNYTDARRNTEIWATDSSPSHARLCR